MTPEEIKVQAKAKLDALKVESMRKAKIVAIRMKTFKERNRRFQK